MFLSACEKDEFQNSFKSPSKLLVSIKENDKLIFEFKYDDLNRLVQIDKYPSGSTVCTSEFYEYDSQNRLISKTYGEFIETFEYNSSGKLKATTRHYQPNDKEWEIEYQYNKGLISKGITYYNGLEWGSVQYKYDSRGNTIERTEYSISSEYTDNIISQFKYTYDNKVNPYLFSGFSFWSECPVDIIQGNNPTYSYYYNINMSMFPPQYVFTYDYDNTGLPIKEYREELQEYGVSSVFEYEYMDKEE